MKDFFSEFHKQNRPHWVLSVVFALFLSFGTVWLIITGPMGLQADVSKSKNSLYAADLILRVDAGKWTIIFGSEASEVETVRFTLLGDPERFTTLSSEDANTEISKGLPGIYSVQIDMKKWALRPWQVLAHFTVPNLSWSRLTMTDTDFVSGSGVYNLTNQVQ